MQLNASATSGSGWGETTVPGFSTFPGPNPTSSPLHEQQGFSPGIQHQPPPTVFVGVAAFPSPKAGGASSQPALNFEGFTQNSSMTSPKDNHGTGPGPRPGGTAFGSLWGMTAGAGTSMAHQNSHNTNSAFNNPGDPDAERFPPVVPLAEKVHSTSPINNNMLRAGLGGIGGNGRSTSPTQGKNLKASKKLPQPPQDAPVQSWGFAGPDVTFGGGGGAAPALGLQNPHNPNSAFNHPDDPDDDRPPVVSLGEKGRSPINLLRAGLSSLGGARSMSPTHGKTLKANKKQQQQPQNAPVQAWGVTGPDINLTSFAQADHNRQGTQEAWGDWGGDVGDEGDAWGGPAVNHAAADHKWGSTEPTAGVSGWGPSSPAGPGRTVTWQDPTIDTLPGSKTLQDFPQQTTRGKGKKGKKSKKGKMSGDDEYHNPLDGGLSSSWGQGRGAWGDHGDGDADEWGAADGDHDGGWGATDDYGARGRHPLPKVTVAAATRLSGGKPQTAFADSGLEPKDVNPTVRIEGSDGKALEPALHALYGMHRVAEGRIIWTLPVSSPPHVIFSTKVALVWS